MTSTALAATCSLPQLSGRIVNNTNLPTEDISLKLEIYAPERGSSFASRDPSYFKQKVDVRIEDDGSFTLPKMNFTKVDGLYIFPGFYNSKTQEPLTTIGMTRYGLFHEMLSVTAFLCSEKSYIKEYKSFFSRLIIQDLGNIKVSIKTPEDETFKDYITELFKKNRPEYLGDEFYYELRFNSHLKITAKSDNAANLEGYINSEHFMWQGLKECNTYEVCFGTSQLPESLNKKQLDLIINKPQTSSEVVIVPENQLAGPLSYELVADFNIVIFKKDSPVIFEHVFFRKDPSKKTLIFSGTLEEVNREHELNLENPTFCKSKTFEPCI